MADEAALEAALGDVRRAFRLIWCYQERIFDVIRTITAEFESLSFYVWEPHNAARIDRSTNPVTKGPWYTLPMMNVSYLYKSSADTNYLRPGDWLFEIRVISDSGYNEEDGGNESIDPAHFPGVEVAESKISLYVYYFTGEIKQNLLNIWHEIEWPDPDGEAREESERPLTKFGISLKLAALPGKEEVQAAARTFKEAASEALHANLA